MCGGKMIISTRRKSITVNKRTGKFCLYIRYFTKSTVLYVYLIAYLGPILRRQCRERVLLPHKLIIDVIGLQLSQKSILFYCSKTFTTIENNEFYYRFSNLYLSYKGQVYCVYNFNFDQLLFFNGMYTLKMQRVREKRTNTFLRRSVNPSTVMPSSHSTPT